MIAIIDYGMGNLGSVRKGFEKAGLDAIVVSDIQSIRNAGGIVLPGVGAISAAMHNINKYGIADTIIEEIQKGKPFLGICLGLQMLFDYSEEGGHISGMGVFPGKVVKFGDKHKVPHIGWNQISIKNRDFWGDNIADGSYFYFVHSYYVVPQNADIIMTTTDYGVDFVSSIHKDNITACQFHPEKSQKLGLKVLELFGQSLSCD